MDAQQEVGTFEPFHVDRQFWFQGVLHRPIGGAVVALRPPPPKPAQYPKAVGFDRQAARNPAEQQDLFRPGVADGGELLQSFFGIGVRQGQNRVEVAGKLIQGDPRDFPPPKDAHREFIGCECAAIGIHPRYGGADVLHVELDGEDGAEDSDVFLVDDWVDDWLELWVAALPPLSFGWDSGGTAGAAPLPPLPPPMVAQATVIANDQAEASTEDLGSKTMEENPHKNNRPTPKR